MGWHDIRTSAGEMPHHVVEADDVAPLRFLAGDLAAEARKVALTLAETAVERDRRGGTAKAERDVIRRSGLLGAWVTRELGGAGASLREVLEVVRLWSRVDSSLGHVFGFHHLLLATCQLFGTPEQWRELHRETVEARLFWGNALNPLDPSTTITPAGADFEVSGTKSFSSGSVDSDRLIISALDAHTKKLVVAAVPTGRAGIRVLGDWDSIGQRQTDSGGVVFERVQVKRAEILAEPGPLGSVRAGLRPLIAQLILANVYLGLAEGAWLEGRVYTRTKTRPWPGSGAASASQDPLILRKYGEFLLTIAASRALLDRAGEELDQAWAREDALTADERGRLAVSVALAKVSSTRAALELSSGIFEVMGARATAAHSGFDRFWRNARTHTLHDPVEHKLKELGQFALLAEVPPPSFYS